MSTCTIPSSSAAAARLPRRRSNRERRTEDRGQRTENEAAIRRLPSVICRLNGEDNEPRDYESFQPASAGSGLRPDPDFDRESGEDSVLVLRRDQKARDDQLSHLQARARWFVLRAHLWADQGLRMLVRQVQADEVQGHYLREVLGRGDAVAGAP